MNIYLIRHGDAEKSNIDKKDFDRELTHQGKIITRTAAIYWKHIIPHLDYIISSPLIRAVQTAEIIKEVFTKDTKLLTDKKLSPGSRTQDLLELLLAYTFKNIAIVGHQPDLSDHLSAFISGNGTFVEFKKSSLAKISFGTKIKLGKGTLECLIPAEVFSVK